MVRIIKIIYDEIYFGKPYADVCIDDNAYRFRFLDKIDGNGNSLQLSAEAKLRGDNNS